MKGLHPQVRPDGLVHIDGLAPPGYEDKFQRVLARLQQKSPAALPGGGGESGQPGPGGTPTRGSSPSGRAILSPAASIGQVHRAVTRRGRAGGGEGTVTPASTRPSKTTSRASRCSRDDDRPHRRAALSRPRRRSTRSRTCSSPRSTTGARRKRSRSSVRFTPKTATWSHPRGSCTRSRASACSRSSSSEAWTTRRSASAPRRRTAIRPGKRSRASCSGRSGGTGLLYADPHPGNYRFLGGGRVAFLDFGCHKRLDTPLVDGMKRYIVALQKGDLPEFYRACVDVLGYDPDDQDSFALYTEYTKLVLTPFVVDGSFKFTKEFARESVAFLVRGGRKLVFKPNEALPNLPAPVRMPSDLTFVNRLQWGFTSILAGLGAEANWRAPRPESPGFTGRPRRSPRPPRRPHVQEERGGRWLNSMNSPSSANVTTREKRCVPRESRRPLPSRLLLHPRPARHAAVRSTPGFERDPVRSYGDPAQRGLPSFTPRTSTPCGASPAAASRVGSAAFISIRPSTRAATSPNTTTRSTPLHGAR